MKKLYAAQYEERINRVIKYLEEESKRALEHSGSEECDDYRFWRGHWNGTANALSKLEWELSH